MSLPVVHLDGEPYEHGRQHGVALGEQIAHNLAVYYDRFQREGQLAPDEVRSRAARYIPVLQGHAAYFDTLRGIAAATGLELLDLVMLNVRYELLYYQYSVLPVGEPDGCTSFALLPEATTTGHVLLGQNWDWIPDVKCAVLQTRHTLALTEAGIVGGKIGLNSAGLGLAINGMLSTSDDWSRLSMPFHARCYDILRSRTVDEAAAVVRDRPRPCSANFVLAQPPDSVLDVETAPDTVCELGSARGALAHTNHFLDPQRLGIQEPQSERRPHSYTRLARMRELIEARRPLSVADLQSCLRDHDNYPDSICRHTHPDDPPEEVCVSVVSAVMDLQERILWITDGHPCEHIYEPHKL